MQVFITHLRQFVDYQIDNFVSTSEMMVERYGHTVFKAGLLYSVLQSGELAAFGLQFASGSNYL